MKDFTLKVYVLLLKTLKEAGYKFQTFSEFLKNPYEKVILLRHDIDLKKRQSLVFATIEKNLGIRATYYFRVVKNIFDPFIIQKIIELQHEIGYHYEDLSLANGNYQKAIKLFEEHLNMFRQYYPVTSICMHGKSLSKFDNKKLWDHFNFKDFGILGEPYISLNFNEILYLTDTAQRWNGSDIAVRDKVESNFKYSFKTTFDIISLKDNLPKRIMLNVHPDRWTDNWIEWYRINNVVKMKNFIKKVILNKLWS